MGRSIFWFEVVSMFEGTEERGTSSAPCYVWSHLLLYEQLTY